MSPIAESVSTGNASLDKLIERIDEISTLPYIAMQIMEIMNDPKKGAYEIRQVMEFDPALSARVLRCVNSSAFALRSRISNLQQAISYLGLKQIRNLAMVASVSEMFKSESSIGLYRRSDLWKHLVSVGICTRLLAMRLGFPNFEDMFLAGLLHDIGIILEDQHCHPEFVAMIRNLDYAKTFPQNEQAFMGFDHTQLGAKVAAKWNFPDGILDAIRFHHTSVIYKGENIDVIRCVEVANIICTLKGITAAGVKLGKPSFVAVQALKLSKDDLAVMSQDLDTELEKNSTLLHVGGD